MCWCALCMIVRMVYAGSCANLRSMSQSSMLTCCDSARQVNSRIWGIEQERMRQDVQAVEATVEHQHLRDAGSSGDSSGIGSSSPGASGLYQTTALAGKLLRCGGSPSHPTVNADTAGSVIGQFKVVSKKRAGGTCSGACRGWAAGGAAGGAVVQVVEWLTQRDEMKHLVRCRGCAAGGTAGASVGAAAEAGGAAQPHADAAAGAKPALRGAGPRQRGVDWEHLVCLTASRSAASRRPTAR